MTPGMMTHQEPVRFRRMILMGTIGLVPTFGSVAELPVKLGGRVPVKDERLVTRFLSRRVMRNRISPGQLFRCRFHHARRIST